MRVRVIIFLTVLAVTASFISVNRIHAQKMFTIGVKSWAANWDPPAFGANFDSEEETNLMWGPYITFGTTRINFTASFLTSVGHFEIFTSFDDEMGNFFEDETEFSRNDFGATLSFQLVPT